MRTFFLLLALSLFSACQLVPVGAEHLASPEGDVVIKSGTSFGFCIGYCKTELQLDSDEAVYIRSAWPHQQDDLPDQVQQRELEADQWERVLAALDLETFFALESVYGCPDCADGGAEWIEVTYEDRTHRVTFEYNDTLEPIEDLTVVLRELRTSFEDQQ